MRVRITLACTECKQRNYNTTKEKKNHPERLETSKYCRFCRKHTAHKETKQQDCLKELNMSNETKKTGIKNWFRGLQAEFHKISWPDKDRLKKETITVTTVAIVLGVIVATLDMILQQGISFLI